ncbi:MAG TPA: Hsp70 family protein, partial [Firmicutes bacterium]|nr:Hsp70 family protein [Bacillota bacterium]
LVEARNNADATVYSVEKSLRELGDKVDAAKEKEIQKAVSRLKEAAAGDDLARIEKASDELTKHLHELSTRLYEKVRQDTQGNQQQDNRSGSDEKVVDADYEVVDDDNKKE